jgi:soluble lytic murein transglycosylase-like protein
MRNHRVALIAICTTAALAVAVPVIYPGAAAPIHQERTSWTTSWRTGLPEQPSASDQQVAEQQFVSYTTTVLANEEAALRAIAAQQAAEAAARAAAAQATTRTAQSTATTSQPTQSYGGEIPSVGDPSVWACIIRHESGGNPGAVNPSSGAGGLFQFLPSTWWGLGGSGLPENAPVAVQVAMAAAAYNGSYWHPWVGDGCTPIG